MARAHASNRFGYQLECSNLACCRMLNMRSLISELRLFVANHYVNFLPSHRLRKLYYCKVMKFKIGSGSSIHLGCRFDAALGLEIGCDSTINDFCVLDTRAGIRIGNNVTLGSGVWLITASHDINTPTFVGITSPIKIGDYAFVGRRATVLLGCDLGVGAVLGAGSVLTKSIPDYEIWAGNPARKIGTRACKQFIYNCRYDRAFH